MGPRYEVYGTRKDWIPGLSKIEDELQPCFSELGLYATRDLRSFPSLARLDDLGISRSGAHGGERSFFISPKGTLLRMTEVPQRKGGVLYKVVHEDNGVCVCFCPGGIFQEQCLVPGVIGTLSDSREASEFFLHVSSSLLAGFRQVKEYMVGPEAMQLLDSGFRLTYNHKRPLADDFKR